jgi:hypothetical protein
MKARIAVICVFVCSVIGVTGKVYADFDFSDIQYWAGSGSNQAALVIDWNDGKESQSLVWGYRWDGTATGEDMLAAIAGQGFYMERDGGSYLGDLSGIDNRLYARLTTWDPSLGSSVFGLGYDLDGDGGTFISGYEGNEIGYAGDSDDHYQEGWYTGYWSYYLGTDPYSGGSWDYSGLGMSSRVLANGSWDGWSYASAESGWYGGTPDMPVSAVPEPASTALFILGSASMALRRLRKNRTLNRGKP